MRTIYLTSSTTLFFCYISHLSSVIIVFGSFLKNEFVLVTCQARCIKMFDAFAVSMNHFAFMKYYSYESYSYMYMYIL